MNAKIVCVATCALLGALVGSNGIAEAQSAQSLANLTVPQGRLPPGCSLKPADAKPSIDPQLGVLVVAGNAGSLVLTNPWSGTDRQLAASIRRRVDGTPPSPDGLPLDRREATAYALKWADDVVEAYRATYRSADESLIDVFAIRFDDETLALPEPPAGTRDLPRGVTSRVILGPSVVLISAGASSGCFQAIDDYIKALR